MPHHHHHRHESKTRWVVFLTAITMVIEIAFGLITNSMALLADGIHMASHVLAIGLSWIAYIFVRKLSDDDKFTGNTEKILSLSGFSSGLMLLIFAIVIMVEAVERFFNPLEIIYMEAIMIAIIGLVVNIASAFILHHEHEHSDHNIRAAYLHVIADALTSLSAILGFASPKFGTFPSLILSLPWSVLFLLSNGR